MKQPDKKYNDEDNMLVNDLRSIVSKARSKAFAAVNYSLVERNWRIGQRIVEEEQNGASRAEYGKHVIEVASAVLTEEFWKGSHIRTWPTTKDSIRRSTTYKFFRQCLRNSTIQFNRHCLLNYLRTFKKGRQCLPNSSYGFFLGLITSVIYE